MKPLLNSSFRFLPVFPLFLLSTSVFSQLLPTLSIIDDNYGQTSVDFSVPLQATISNTVIWEATDLEHRGGNLFTRFDTAPTVELLPDDIAVTFAGTEVPATKAGFNALEFHIASIPDLGTGGTISYSITFNSELELNNSRIDISTSGEPFVASNELSHQITVGTPLPPPPLPTLSITDDNYGQTNVDFSVPLQATLSNTVIWEATDLEGRRGNLFTRFDTAPTVELLPDDITVTFAGTEVSAIKAGFNALDFHIASIPDLGTGGTITYSITFNSELELNNSCIDISTSGEPFVASNELAHQITVGTPPPPPPLPTLSITDDNYGQPSVDFSVPVQTTLSNTVIWQATDLEGRGGNLFTRFDTALTVELLPDDITVTFAATEVPAIKAGFNALDFHIASIPNLGTGGTISYSITFNSELELSNSRIDISTSGEPFVASNELSHQITVEASSHPVRVPSPVPVLSVRGVILLVIILLCVGLHYNSGAREWGRTKVSM